MSTALDIGSALESAVCAIERTILQTAPGLAENTFTIESKKVVIVGGVRHEIDVYVAVEAARGYGSVFIFECKNLRAAVGKNDIIVFSEKIDALQAQRGYFVAKSFSRYAERQAERDPRVTLLFASEFAPEDTPVPFDFHVAGMQTTHGDVEFQQRGAAGDSVHRPFDTSRVPARVNGPDVDLGAYIDQWITDAANDDLRSFPSSALPEGMHEYVTNHSRQFGLGELVVDGVDMEAASLALRRTVRVSRPPVVSHFQIQGRGRSLSLAPVDIGCATIQIGMVGM